MTPPSFHLGKALREGKGDTSQVDNCRYTADRYIADILQIDYGRSQIYHRLGRFHIKSILYENFMC